MGASNSTEIKLFVGIAMIFVKFGGMAPIRPEDTPAFIRMGLTLKEIACNGDGMTIEVTDNIPMCHCRPGQYLKSRSLHDSSLAECAPCLPCDPKGSRPFQVQECGSYSLPVCCQYPNMTTEMTAHGFFDCVMPAPESVVNKSDGSGDPECGDRWFLENDTHCQRCKECVNFPETPHEIRPCTNTSDTVCCARNDSVVFETESGLQCSHGASETPNIDVAKEVAKDADAMTGCNRTGMTVVDRNGTLVCVCADGYDAYVTEGHITCKDSKVEINHHYGNDHYHSGDNRQKEKMSRSWIYVIIVAMFLMLIPCYIVHKKGLCSFFGSNQYHINKLALEKERRIEARNEIEMQPINRQASDSVRG